MTRKPRKKQKLILSKAQALQTKFAIPESYEYEILLEWAPAVQNPLTVLLLRCDNITLVRDTYLKMPPGVFVIPTQPQNGSFVIDWHIAPEIRADFISLTLRNRANANKLLIGYTTNAKRGDVWSGGGRYNAP